MKLLFILTIFFVQFTDKGESDRIALSNTAIEMREARGIAIDSLDYAVSAVYLDSISSLGGRVLHTSRWLNGATIEATYAAQNKMLTCSFVDTIYTTRETTSVEIKPAPKQNKWKEVLNDSVIHGQAETQLQLLNLPTLHQAGFEGQGIRIGIADVGFAHADSLEALQNVREQWLGYADLTDDKYDIFGIESSHGTLCLTTILGMADTYRGAATKTEYFLFKTEEIDTESPKEIDNWVAAVEMADSLGLHILSTSLGYAQFDHDGWSYTYEDMDGQTTRGAKAAQIAARKGMLQVVAMGNDGNNSWHYLSTPADADSILSVGAVNASGVIASFSSYGPTSDGRLKPEVCAVGQDAALINYLNRIVYSNGTSFACPQIAGLAACLWSADPEASNMDIRQRIIASSDRYADPHDRYGYGIPNAWLAYQQTISATQETNTKKNGQKILKNGQLYLFYNNEYYTVVGNKITLQQ